MFQLNKLLATAAHVNLGVLAMAIQFPVTIHVPALPSMKDRIVKVINLLSIFIFMIFN